MCTTTLSSVSNWGSWGYCVREVSLAQVSCVMMYVFVGPPTLVGAWSMALVLWQLIIIIITLYSAKNCTPEKCSSDGWSPPLAQLQGNSHSQWLQSWAQGCCRYPWRTHPENGSWSTLWQKITSYIKKGVYIAIWKNRYNIIKAIVRKQMLSNTCESTGRS